MELTELSESIKELFDFETIEELPKKVMEVVVRNDTNVYKKFVEKVEHLEKEWFQSIYQYWLADRKDNKQDFTPVSIAKLVSKMIDGDEVVDMCCGSGALIIQAWTQNKNIKAKCIEFDLNVIPLLLFNLAVRNIEAVVYRKNVLTDELFDTWKIEKQEEFGEVVKL